MELRDFEYFSVLARYGHLGRAAEALGLSQSALSKSLRRMEQEMRVKLVKRTPKGVELTAEGSTLLSHADRLRASLDDVVREVADVKQGLAGHLRVSAATGYFVHLLPTACAALRKHAPNATIRLREFSVTDAIYALRNGELDLLIAEPRPSMGHDITQEFLYDDRRVVFASANHRLAGKKRVALAELARENWAVVPRASTITRVLYSVFEQHGLPPPRITVETGSTALRLPLVAASDLLGYSWTSIVRGAAPHLRLAEINVPELSSTFPANLYYRKDAYHSPLGRRFIDILKSTARQLFTEQCRPQ